MVAHTKARLLEIFDIHVDAPTWEGTKALKRVCFIQQTQFNLIAITFPVIESQS